VAASVYREVHRGFGSVSASYHGAFERLEPDEVNISSPVLRGRRAVTGPLLPDPRVGFVLYQLIDFYF
jgi:hypothetical protein